MPRLFVAVILTLTILHSPVLAQQAPASISAEEAAALRAEMMWRP
jgi:hypothetical protein